MAPLTNNAASAVRCMMMSAIFFYRKTNEKDSKLGNDNLEWKSLEGKFEYTVKLGYNEHGCCWLFRTNLAFPICLL